MNERERQLARLETDMADACGALNVAHARLVDIAAELIETELWKGYGIRSIEHYLCWQTGLSPERARQIATIARRRAELPVLMDTFGKGELAVDQVVAVAKNTPAHNDAEVTDFAKVATVTQLRSTLSRYTTDTQPAVDTAAVDTATTDAFAEGEATERAAERAAAGRLSMFNDGTRFIMRVDAPADEGALIEQAVLEAKDARFGAGQPDVTAMDGLLEMANRSLSGLTSTSRRSKYRIYVHLDTDGGWLNQGPTLPKTLLDKICCDGVIAPVWETDGAPVNVGRAQRIVPDRTRRLVEDRDRICVFPGCGNNQHLEAHHLIHWADGGGTDTANIGMLCPPHHDAHHRDEFTINGNADIPGNLVFTDAAGRTLATTGTPTPPTGSPPGPPDGHRYRHPIGEPVQTKWVYFSPPPITPPESGPRERGSPGVDRGSPDEEPPNAA